MGGTHEGGGVPLKVEVIRRRNVDLKGKRGEKGVDEEHLEQLERFEAGNLEKRRLGERGGIHYCDGRAQHTGEKSLPGPEQRSGIDLEQILAPAVGLEVSAKPSGKRQSYTLGVREKGWEGHEDPVATKFLDNERSQGEAATGQDMGSEEKLARLRGDDVRVSAEGKKLSWANLALKPFNNVGSSWGKGIKDYEVGKGNVHLRVISPRKSP